jgi:hypothetical protein
VCGCARRACGRFIGDSGLAGSNNNKKDVYYYYYYEREQKRKIASSDVGGLVATTTILYVIREIHIYIILYSCAGRLRAQNDFFLFPLFRHPLSFVIYTPRQPAPNVALLSNDDDDDDDDNDDGDEDGDVNDDKRLSIFSRVLIPRHTRRIIHIYSIIIIIIFFRAR